MFERNGQKLGSVIADAGSSKVAKKAAPAKKAETPEPANKPAKPAEPESKKED